MWTFAARALTRLASAAGLLALVVGIPVGQLHYLGSPLPDRMPSADELRTALTSRDWMTDATLIDGLSVLLWLLWALFIVSVVVELAASIRGVQAPRYRLLAPTQGIAAALVAGLTATIVATAPAPALAPSTFTPPARASTPAAAVVVVPAVHTSAPAAQVNAVALKPVGSVTVLIDGRPYEHKVVKGESLWRIADQYLGDPQRWPEIWELNKGKYWPHVSGRTTFRDPDLIFPGWVLTLPADAAAPPGARPTDPPTESTPPSGTTSPAPSANPTPSTSTTATATPTPTVTAPAGGGVLPTPPALPTPSTAVTPAPSTNASGSATPSRSTTASPGASATPTGSSTAADEDDPSSGMPGWIEIAGGFIGAGLGLGLLYAAAMVWKRRRHHYQPTPITNPVLDDPDLNPPLGALTHIRQTLRRHTPELLDHKPEPGPTVRQYTAADVKPPLPPVGPTGAELAGVGTLPFCAGLGLAGPAALHAARALLAATLASGHADDPDAQGQAIVPAATIATLLGVSAVDLGPMHRLTVAPSFADALTLVEEEIIRRSRIIADREATDVPALRATEALAEPLPQLLLIADVPEQGWHTRLATAIRLGKAVEIGTTLIGDWPHGTTLTVAPDGSTTGGDGQRVAVLDTAATSEILTMLREAHGDAAPTRRAPAPTVPEGQDTPAPTGPAGHDAPAPSPAAESGDETAPPARAAITTPPDRPSTPTGVRVVSVRVLGSPAILGTDGTPVRGLRAKSLELLVYLAVHRRGASLDDIMEAIWGDATPRRAAERLSTCVGNLRGVIRTVAQPSPATEDGDGNEKNRKQIDPVVNTGSHYHLDPALLRVDWWTVLDEYAQVAAADDDTARLAHLQTAIGAIGGGLADGMDYEWIDTDREHTRRRTVKIYAQAAQLLVDTDPHQSRAYTDIACELDPLCDELARRAMHAAAQVGDADAVRDRLTVLRRSLDDAGIELDPGTEQLATNLLRDLANP
ncbi:MAG TPA: LysM peptidoglycan-binding domain-containing protein [Micromonosporaceae bacterium]|nr:LysM peptidoglycan-binding domain-containing protein [Micromonosporaceae bacterium]